MEWWCNIVWNHICVYEILLFSLFIRILDYLESYKIVKNPSDCNGTWTHNHLVFKGTVSVRLRTNWL